jgi:prepilin-type N-terminal cleavage/methylation domain-containing protein
MHHINNIKSTMRAGWTMIELIFVIVIIGILAAVAIPKLATTRDDAKLSTTVHNMNVCIRDTSAHYTATGMDYNETVHPRACDRNNTLCYDFNYSVNGIDFNVSTNPDAAIYCADIDYVGGHLAKSYDFGGKGIER